jgi:hypothetical protein
MNEHSGTLSKLTLQTEITSHVSQRTLALHQPGLSRISYRWRASAIRWNRSSLRLRLTAQKALHRAGFSLNGFFAPRPARPGPDRWPRSEPRVTGGRTSDTFAAGYPRALLALPRWRRAHFWLVNFGGVRGAAVVGYGTSLRRFGASAYGGFRANHHRLRLPDFFALADRACLARSLLTNGIRPAESPVNISLPGRAGDAGRARR